MARKKGSTAQLKAELSAWVLQQFRDNSGNWPPRFAKAQIMAEFDLSTRSADLYYREGKEAFQQSIQDAGGGVMSEAERLKRALAYLAASDEALYLARQAEDSRKIAAAVRACIAAEDQLRQLNPNAIFESVAARRAAFRQAKEDHLNDPPHWEQ